MLKCLTISRLRKLAECGHLLVLGRLPDDVAEDVDVEGLEGPGGHGAGQQGRVHLGVVEVHPAFVLGDTLDPEPRRMYRVRY